MATRFRIEPRRFVASGSRSEPTPQLTEDQWFLIEDLFREPPPSPLGGRPRHSNRDCLEVILFVLLTGCRWEDLPASFPSKSACNQRFSLRVTIGVFQFAWRLLLELKADIKQLDLDTLLGNATFILA